MGSFLGLGFVLVGFSRVFGIGYTRFFEADRAEMGRLDIVYNVLCNVLFTATVW